jgi:SpoVK/Ycf46/Vps4 family AAA+-type ATPase
MKPEVTRKIPKIIVYGSNGFDDLIQRFRTYTGKSFQVLFFDPSGTGKTVAADIIAAELNRKIYRADIHSSLSKHTGETEKKLDRIFSEASSMKAILFFEEADVLFRESMETGDRAGCYNNMEIKYLLHKMEEYDGIVILAVHHSKNIDEAFIRNMRFVVEFPPDRRKQKSEKTK